MKNDVQIQASIIDELRWDPILNAAEIGVTVKNGIATLSGVVDSYAKKIAAENAAKRVTGVRAVAEDIQVGPSDALQRSDTEIAQAVLNALRWHAAIEEEKIKVRVDDGNVWLEGEVEWEYQRSNARNCIEHLSGVRSIINAIVIKPRTAAKLLDVQQKIGAALQRNASLAAKQIEVSVVGSKAILNGTVRSFAEREAAVMAAWSAPGITEVDNRLVIEVPEFAFED